MKDIFTFIQFNIFCWLLICAGFLLIIVDYPPEGDIVGAFGSGFFLAIWCSNLKDYKLKEVGK